MDNKIIPFGILTHVLTGNGTQFLRKFFKSPCGFLGTKHLTTTTYHPEPNRQGERLNMTSIARLQNYKAEHEGDRIICVQNLTYEYNSQRHRTLNPPHHSLALSRQPPGPATFKSLIELLTDTTATTSPQGTRARVLHQVATLRQDVDKRITSLQRGYRDDHDKEFAIRHCCLLQDSISILTGHQWLHLRWASGDWVGQLADATKDRTFLVNRCIADDSHG